MRLRVAIVYNRPVPSRYDAAGEEKAVSGVLDAVGAVARSLRELDCEVSCVPLVPPAERALEKLGALDVDLVFNLFEGFCGEPESETLVPEYLERIGVPFTGCPFATLGLCLDKARVKVLLQACGIPTPDFQLLRPETLHLFRLGYPCIVKPRGDDASHGIDETSVAGDFSTLERQVGLVSEAYGVALVEEFVGGREFNATVLGGNRGTVLPPSEIVYSLPPELPRILTFSAKWEPDSPYYRGTRAVCPAEIETWERECLGTTARAVYRLLGYRGYARVDMRMDDRGQLHVIEVNPNPDISPGAGAARQAAAAGMDYTRFIEKIIHIALEKEEHGRQDSSYTEKRQAVPDAAAAAHTRVQAV